MIEHCELFAGVLNMSTTTESPLRFSCHTLDKATKAKVGTQSQFCIFKVYFQVTLENYYNNLISQHRERRDRLKRLEESLNENGLSETV